MTATKDDVTKYTKPELIRALRAAWAREARLAKKIEKLQGTQAAPPPLHPGPYDVAAAFEASGTGNRERAEDEYARARRGGKVRELVPTFCGLCNVATKPPNCEVEGCPHAAAGGPEPYEESESAAEIIESVLPGSMFPWEQK